MGFKFMSNTKVYKSIWTMMSRSHSIHLLMPEVKQSRSPFRVCAGASLRPRVRGAPAGWPGCWTRWSSTSEHTVSGATINKGRNPNFPFEQLTNKDGTRQKNRKTDKMKDRQTRQKYGPTEKIERKSAVYYNYYSSNSSSLNIARHETNRREYM